MVFTDRILIVALTERIAIMVFYEKNIVLYIVHCARAAKKVFECNDRPGRPSRLGSKPMCSARIATLGGSIIGRGVNYYL